MWLQNRASIVCSTCNDEGVSQKDPPALLDLNRWESVEEAIAELSQRSRAFDDALAPYLELNMKAAGGALTMYLMFVMSAATRARGLHEAIVREIRQSNPHAVFPLMRTLLETAALSFYVSEHPDYVRSIAERPGEAQPGTPRRRSPQSLIDYMDRSGLTHQLAAVYRELCEITHFGTVGMWAAYTADEENERRFTWSSAPRFRGDTAMVACAQLDELTTMMEGAMRRSGRTLLTVHGIEAAGA